MLAHFQKIIPVHNQAVFSHTASNTCENLSQPELHNKINTEYQVQD